MCNVHKQGMDVCTGTHCCANQCHYITNYFHQLHSIISLRHNYITVYQQYTCYLLHSLYINFCRQECVPNGYECSCYSWGSCCYQIFKAL